MIDNIKAKVLLADRGYDSDAIVEKAEKAGMKAVIPPRKNRKTQREYDKELYKLRHFVENAFMILKRWRGVATRYAKSLSTNKLILIAPCAILSSRKNNGGKHGNDKAENMGNNG